MNEIDQLRQEIINSETFCFYPFLELSTNPAGHVRPCCYYTNVLFKNPESFNYNESYSLIRGDKLEDIWNSDAVKHVRKKLTSGEWINDCQACKRDGAASMRARSVKEYKNNYEILKLVNNTIKNDYVAEHLPKRLEIKPSNLCNLKCVMCNSFDSSQVAKELKELAVKFKGINVDSGRYIKINANVEGIYEKNQAFYGIDQPDWSDNEEVWDSLIKIFPYVEVLSFAGGEPTLLPFVEKTLKYCVDNEFSKNIKVFLSSNFTNINNRLVELMPEFKEFEIIASIDGIEKVNDFCRFPSKWSQVSKNYQTVKNLMGKHPNVKILINVTVNILNVMNLDDLLFWIDDQAKNYPYYREWPYNINLIVYPEDQRINNLPPNLKRIAAERLMNYKSKSVVLKDFPDIIAKIDLLINELQLDHTEENNLKLKEFVERITVLNNHRNVNILDYIPDLAEAFVNDKQ